MFVCTAYPSPPPMIGPSHSCLKYAHVSLVPRRLSYFQENGRAKEGGKAKGRASSFPFPWSLALRARAQSQKNKCEVPEEEAVHTWYACMYMIKKTW